LGEDALSKIARQSIQVCAHPGDDVVTDAAKVNNYEIDAVGLERAHVRLHALDILHWLFQNTTRETRRSAGDRN